MNKKPLVLSSLALLTALAVGAWFYTYVRTHTPAPDQTAPEVTIGGPFTLTDETGEKFSSAELTGKYWLVYFGFTFCPDICPMTLQTMTQALFALEERRPQLAAQTVPVFITIDPERDDVAEMRAYASHFHPRLKALTGTPAEIRDVARAFKIYYAKADPEGGAYDPGLTDYVMDHSSAVYLMGPDGEFQSFFSHTATAEEIAAGIETAAGG